MKKSIANCLIVFVSLVFFSVTAYGNDDSEEKLRSRSGNQLQSLLISLIKNHEEIKSIQSQVEEIQAQYQKSKGLYYPSIDLSANGGQEKIDREFGADTDETRYEATLRATQLITDFGKTNHTIDRAGVLLEQKQIQLKSTRQQLMLEGIQAYINIVRARERLKLARQSEARIKELTGIEKTLVDKGAGLSSDVLQAKSQLTGAMALRVEAQGELHLAKNRFQAVFYRTPTTVEIEQFEDVQFPYKKLPLQLEQAIESAQKENPELLITQYNTKLAQKDVDIAKTAFYPRFNVFAEALRKENDAGVDGYENEGSVGIELRYNLLNGGSDKAALKSAYAAKKVAAYHADYVQRIIREQVSNSWEQLSIYRQKNELLDQQAAIVENFLLLAKKERKMGTRSLLDVLNGEINYINATSTAIAARQDTKIAAFNLLYSMGQIGLELFE